MNDDQITALAREYAEFTDLSPVDKKNISAICENFLKYTLCRYYLVEKSKIQYEYRSAKECLNKIPTLSIIGSVINGQIITLESLFPEIAKEVEK